MYLEMETEIKQAVGTAERCTRNARAKSSFCFARNHLFCKFIFWNNLMTSRWYI